jgi:parallel beta-helix repeat protein
MRKWIFFTFLMGMCLISLQSTNAATITVHPGGSIQSAVNHAASGDTVLVFSNGTNAYTYKENVIVNKKVNIVANGKVTIQAKNSGSSVFRVNSGGSGSSIKYFTLTKSNYCIFVNDATNTEIYGNKILGASLVGVQLNGNIKNSKILNNYITGPNTHSGNGISFQFTPTTSLTSYNTISGNTIKNFLFGILFNAKSTQNIVSNNKIYCPNDGSGIYATQDSSYMTINGNTVSGAQDAIAVEKLGTGQATHYTINGNTVENSANGLWVCLSYSTISNNQALNNKVSGIDIKGDGNKITGNTVRNNKICGIAICTTDSGTQNTLSNNILGSNGGNYYITGLGKVIGA